MNLHAKLQRRAGRRQAAARRPDRRRQVRLDVPGADPAHAGRAPGRHRRPLARRTRARTWRASAGSRSARRRRASTTRVKHGTTHIGDDWQALVAHPAIDIVVECTGHPIAAVEHCLEAFAHGKHVVNVTVEADAFCGPLLARKAAEAGVVYSLAFGDQPALICDLVDWARTCGFPVVGGRPRPQVAAALRASRRPRRSGATTASRPSRPSAAA